MDVQLTGYQLALRYALIVHGQQRMKQLSSDEAIELSFACRLHAKYQQDITTALIELGFPVSARALQIIQSPQPPIAAATGREWNTSEDIAIFWAAFHNQTQSMFRVVPDRSQKACETQLSRWRDILVEYDLDAMITQKLVEVSDNIEALVSQCEDEETRWSGVEPTIGQGPIGMLTRAEAAAAEVLGSDSVLHLNALAQGRKQAQEKRDRKNQQLGEARQSRIEKRSGQSGEERRGDACVQRRDFAPLFHHVLKQSQGNLHRGKPEYDDAMKWFWLHLYMLGRKSFTFMQTMLHGPSTSTLASWFDKRDCPRFSEYRQLDRLPDILKYQMRRTGLKSASVLISVDAMKLDEDICIDHLGNIDGLLGVTSVSDPNHYRTKHSDFLQLWQEARDSKQLVGSMFVVTVCPLARFPCFPLHVHLSNTGNASEEVDRLLMACHELLSSSPLRCEYLGSDADTKYRGRFTDVFCTWTADLADHRGCVHTIEKPALMWCNDAAHLLKRARSRLVTHGRLFASRDGQCRQEAAEKKAKKQKRQCENLADVCMVTPEILMKLNPTMSPTWFRNNGKDAMDDYYPHFIFSGKTLSGILADMGILSMRKVGRKVRKMEAAHLLCYVVPELCMIRILRYKDPTCTRRKRLMWAHLALFIFVLCYDWMKAQGTQDNLKKENYSSFFSMHVCVDSANWLFAVIHIFAEVAESFSMTRIGSIISEHFFALLRYHADKDQTPRAVREAFDRIMVMSDMGEHHQVHIARRLFECAMIEEGTAELSQEEINLCLNTAYKIVRLTGAVFSNSCEFYKLVAPLSGVNIKEFDFPEIELLLTLVNDDFDHQSSAVKPSWRVSTSKFRCGSAKVGRNIRERYATSVKPEDPTPKRTKCRK